MNIPPSLQFIEWFQGRLKCKSLQTTDAKWRQFLKWVDDDHGHQIMISHTTLCVHHLNEQFSHAYDWMMKGTLFAWITLWIMCHTLNRCKEPYFHGKHNDLYTMQWRSQVANFHGQASDAYAWMMQESLFSWITLWNLCHTLDRCKVAYIHGKLHDFYLMQWRNYSDYESTSLCLYSFTLSANINCIVFGFTRSWIETTIYRTWCEYSNYFTTGALLLAITKRLISLE